MLYTALGDSITAGEAATRFGLAYPSIISSMLRASKQFRWVQGEILAEPGWTSLALKNAVLNNPSQYISAATSITIWVGGDDLAYAALAAVREKKPLKIKRAIAGYGAHVKTLIQQIRSVSKASIILCTQYNPFPNSAIAETAIAALNAMTHSIGLQTMCQIAPIDAWFAGRQAELIAGYRSGKIEDVIARAFLPIHPNNHGHTVIATELYPRITLSAYKSLNF